MERQGLFAKNMFLTRFKKTLRLAILSDDRWQDVDNLCTSSPALVNQKRGKRGEMIDESVESMKDKIKEQERIIDGLVKVTNQLAADKEYNEELCYELKEKLKKYKNIISMPLYAINFEKNAIIIKLPKDIIGRGFHAGNVNVDLSDVQNEL